MPSSLTDRLEKTLKTYDGAQSRLAKAQKKGGAKLLAAQQDAHETQRQLQEHLVPEYIATHQKTTLDRLHGVKELSVKWETAQSDLAARRSEASQAGMMRLLAWEPEETVSMLAVQRFGGVPVGAGRSTGPTGTPMRNASVRRPTLQSDAGSVRSATEHASSGFASTLKSKFGRKNSTIVTPSRAAREPARQQSMEPQSSTYATPLATPMMETPAPDAAAGTVDPDGFSVPPRDRGQAPWERQQKARDLLDDDDDEEDGITELPTSASPGMESPPTTTTPTGGKFSSLSLAPQPIIEESEAERAAALAKMQSTLLSSAPSGGSGGSGGGGPSRRATLRARRDVRNTMFTALDRVEDEASLGQVVRAQKESLVSREGGGLSAAFTECVSVHMRQGEVERAVVTGDVSLALKDVERASGTLHIRLDAFEQLDKVAPNPRYLTQYPNTPGEYLLDLAALAHASSSSTTGKAPTLFKYQVHIGDGRATEFAPLEITPQWKPMPGETRLVLLYNANAGSRLAQRDLAASMVDLAVTVTLAAGGANVTTVQAKPPGGTWSPEARAITWNLPPLSASSASGPGKIVARFITEAEEAAVPEPVVASFRVEGTLCTGLGVSVVDDTAGWTFESVKRAVVSGKYVAE